MKFREIYEFGSFGREIPLKFMDAEILARQAAGHHLTNHNRYHELNGGNPPCKGFGNWLVVVPGISLGTWIWHKSS